MISEYLKVYLLELWSLSLEMAPYLILGFLIAGLLHVYLPKNKLKNYIGKPNLRSAIYASIFGIPLPLCSCGVIPTGVSLYKNGASKGSSVSFLISTPQTGIDSILVTYSMLGLPFALMRPIIAFFSGIFGGAITNFITRSERKVQENAVQNDSINSIEYPSFKTRMKDLWNYAFVEFLNDISKWLVIGLLIAAMLAVVLPSDFFSNYITSEWMELVIMLIASIPMYVCATASVPIAAVLIAKGLSPGAALVFLMAGPATNMATILVIGKSMGRRTLISYLFSIITGAIVFGYLINEIDFLRSLFGVVPISEHSHSHLVPEWLGVVSVVFLFYLIINAYFKMKRNHNPSIDVSKEDVLNLKVKGMSCSHCENNVESNVGKLKGVENVNANFSEESVHLKGDAIDLDAVKKTINNLGYEVVD